MSERYELIRREEGNYPVASMCELVGVSKSGYYNWLGRPEAATKARRRKLALLVESEFKASDMTYGYRRITAALKRKGTVVSPDTVRSIMREKGLKAAQPRRKVRTTIPADDIDTRPDLVDRDSRRRGPRAQMGRGHHLHPHVGRIRVSGHCSGLLLPEKVVGYAMADNMKTDLICKAIDMAVRRCPHQEEVTIFHSDRGSQYTSQQFAKHLKNYKILPSVGRTGVCWDNAWAESFNATLKNERVHRMVYPTREKTIKDVASWIELTYNHTRLHSALGYRTPNEAEHELNSRKQAA